MKKVEGFQGVYFVTKDGRVFSKRRNRFLKLHKDKYGYMAVRLYDNDLKKAFTTRIHVLVIAAFGKKPKLHVNHKNGKKDDNRIENLEYVTSSENIRHAYKAGLNRPIKGEGHMWAKLTEKQVRQIKYFETGSQRNIGKKFGITQATVCAIKQGRIWKHITVGD